jgi:hypothetical protein
MRTVQTCREGEPRIIAAAVIDEDVAGYPRVRLSHYGWNKLSQIVGSHTAVIANHLAPAAG